MIVVKGQAQGSFCLIWCQPRLLLAVELWAGSLTSLSVLQFPNLKNVTDITSEGRCKD